MNSSRPKTARPSRLPARPWRVRRMFLLAVGVLVGGVLGAIYAPGLWKQASDEKVPSELTKKEPTEEAGAQEHSPSKPAPGSPYKNTQPGVKYVGSQACMACHEQEHESYQHTGMARSMATVDLSREPPDGAFDHPVSKSRYEVRRKDGQMWHRELLLTGGKEEVLLQEYPVKYVTGSGRHSLTYLVEDDGFLVESPITWYTSRKAWGMSPGYDRANHSSFEREIGETCLFCHAGRIKAEGKSLHRMQIIEAAIGCEQCHGPGELHVERRNQVAKTALSGGENDIDETIVNPSRLTRELSEAICQQCHMRGSASVLARGKTPFDFRPGLPPSDFVLHYELDVPNTRMSVVGHVEQMHQSKCFQGTKTFSCLTCHGPHGQSTGEALTSHYIQVCTSCHQPETCLVSPELREQKSPGNDCLVCHMPQTPTDIPHLAFTHHRVGIHEPTEATAGDPPPAATVLRPTSDVSGYSESELQRSLGFAYLDVASKEEDPIRRKAQQRQAFEILSEVRAAGGGVDGPADVWLAILRFELGMPDANRYAQSALADPQLTGQELCNALFFQADSQLQQRRYADSLQTLEQLGKLRRNSVQWLLAAQCHKALGNEAAMEEALLQAVRINPRLGNIHASLAEIYRRRGDERRAKYHELRRSL